MPTKNRDIVVGEYHFIRFAHRITVKSKGKQDDEELKAIAKLYEEYYISSRRGGILYGGKWQWCPNSEECKKAVYAPICEINKNEGEIFCSYYCRNRILQPRNRKKAIEAKKERRILQWLDGLELSEAACWVLDTIFYKDPERIKQLNIILRISDEKIKNVLKEIYREIPGCGPAYPVANKIIKSYIQSEEGKDFRIPIQKLVGILFYVPAGPQKKLCFWFFGPPSPLRASAFVETSMDNVGRTQ